MGGPPCRSSPSGKPSAAGLAEQPAGLLCRPVGTDAERAAHFAVRHRVFVVEQGLFGGPGGNPGEDIDAHDAEPATIHVVGLAGGIICGTVRLYPLAGPAGRWKGDRLAVLAGHRRHGLGAPLVRFAVAEAARLGGLEMEAHVQPANVAFFEWLGWRRAGGLVVYAGIDHQRMLIPLRAPGWRGRSRRRAG